MAEESKQNNLSTASSAKKPRKRFVGTKSAIPSKPGTSSTITHQIPQDILSDALLNDAIKQLPSNYSFEIHKTIHHVRKNNAKMVALQMPEGLQMFACTIADIIERCAADCLPNNIQAYLNYAGLQSHLPLLWEMSHTVPVVSMITRQLPWVAICLSIMDTVVLVYHLTYWFYAIADFDPSAHGPDKHENFIRLR